MVIRWLLEWWSGVAEWILGQTPRIPPGVMDFFAESVEAFGLITSKLLLLDPVIPFQVLELCWVALWAAIAFAFVVEVVRILASYLTLGGGAT